MKKIMCSNVQNHDGKTFACRACNDCITARKNDWVARAMAEKAMSSETLVLMLSYRNNGDGSLPFQARAFNYNDVRGFLKHLREVYFRKYGARNEIRFIVAGERGSRRGRVHWHMILFADRPITGFGEWTTLGGKPQDGPVITEKGKNQHWSLWRHGLVCPQIPDQGGMAYVLKYALKDQFNSVKSKGTARFAKSEDSGASYFRMSKTPPIGMRWLQARCDGWEKMRAVPPKLELKVPEYSGFWWPKARMREVLLGRLHEINEGIKAETGRDAPQWSTLVTSVVDQEKDWETLTYGEQEKEAEFWDAQQWRVYLEREQSGRARAAAAAATRARCGGAVICKACWNGKDRDERREFREWFEAQKAERASQAVACRERNLDRWFRQKGGCNPHCTLRGTPGHGEKFGA